MLLLVQVISQSFQHRRWTCESNIVTLNNQLMKNVKINKKIMSQSTTNKCQNSTYFFCVSPALTLILRTSRTFLFCELDQDQNDDLRCFSTDDQESEGPSQRREIFSSSPMSSSVKTRNVFVRFRPTPSALWKQRSRVRSSKIILIFKRTHTNNV